MKDNDNVLRGPEIRIPVSESVGEKTLHAIAYHDIFDKKAKKFYVSLQLDSQAWAVLCVIGQQLPPPLSQCLHHYLDHAKERTRFTLK